MGGLLPDCHKIYPLLAGTRRRGAAVTKYLNAAKTSLGQTGLQLPNGIGELPVLLLVSASQASLPLEQVHAVVANPFRLLIASPPDAKHILVLIQKHLSIHGL